VARHEGAGHNGTGARPNDPKKGEIAHLRRAMQDQGCTTEQIAHAIMAKGHYRPRQAWRHAHGWTQEELAHRYNQVINDPSSPVTYKHISEYENWPDSKRRPTLTFLRNLAQVFGTVEWKLIDFDDFDRMNHHERAALKPSSEIPDNGRATQSSHLTTSTTSTLIKPLADASDSVNQARRMADEQRPISDLISHVAFESLRHAENAQGQGMPDVTLDEITAEVERLTKEHLYSDSLSTLTDTIHLRDGIYRLLEYRQYPRQTEHLYYLASIVCALLADDSVSYGFPQAAEDQARAGWTYAEIINHNSLRLWCRTMQANVAYLGNRPQRALQLTMSAEEWATEPIGKVGFYNSIALFSALTGRADEARVALAESFDSYESSTGNSELFDQLGGMFSYSRAKMLQVATMIHLELKDAVNAESTALEAIQLYEASPPELRAFGNEASARIDLGQARLLNDDAEGASDALMPVLQLPTPKRLDWVVLRLQDFSSKLRQHHIGISNLGRQLTLQIEDFVEAPASRALPSGIGK
jgi:transcriptional regulator with XRE-family HTH domain